MRIISEDKTCDIPYEQSVIMMSPIAGGFKVSAVSQGIYHTLAVFDCREEAENLMSEICRRFYANPDTTFEV